MRRKIQAEAEETARSYEQTVREESKVREAVETARGELAAARDALATAHKQSVDIVAAARAERERLIEDGHTKREALLRVTLQQGEGKFHRILQTAREASTRTRRDLTRHLDGTQTARLARDKVPGPVVIIDRENNQELALAEAFAAAQEEEEAQHHTRRHRPPEVRPLRLAELGIGGGPPSVPPPPVLRPRRGPPRGPTEPLIPVYKFENGDWVRYSFTASGKSLNTKGQDVVNLEGDVERTRRWIRNVVKHAYQYASNYEIATGQPPNLGALEKVRESQAFLEEHFKEKQDRVIQLPRSVPTGYELAIPGVTREREQTYAGREAQKRNASHGQAAVAT